MLMPPSLLLALRLRAAEEDTNVSEMVRRWMKSRLQIQLVRVRKEMQRRAN